MDLLYTILSSLQIIIFYASYSINHTLFSYWEIHKFIHKFTYFESIGFINKLYNICNFNQSAKISQ